MLFTKEKQFTPDRVLEILAGGRMSLPKIRQELGCSVSTAEKLAAEMLKTGSIQREDVSGSPKKPFYLYSRSRCFLCGRDDVPMEVKIDKETYGVDIVLCGVCRKRPSTMVECAIKKKLAKEEDKPV